ncbi:MAG: TlyA family rRNA (cytidine-2'-O)-methyltransferase [Neptuniibacter caesariensis]|uniref:TlyA family rRNA (Cytidine-2'-O)-methyltransferase n=1 Tax=Neptuniibacter caesariensis TaxID=207954 RepID=A0A2G6JQ26_NEPCE|nr:MAG: TlyA family rRNA (cytidine-2'-O)-methyltransferase [Neptuniibacter caesariensis]
MQRADLLLVDTGLAQSRTHAQRMIKNEQVTAFFKGRWQLVSKPGIKLDINTEFRISESQLDRYVSRGAIKLQAAFAQCPLDLSDKTAIDVGQSTGGFTDYLLQHGIAQVVGIEVGHDQLAAKLRQDHRVICYEGTNARDLPQEKLLQHTQGKGFDLAVMDVSFISQTKILPSLTPLILPNGYLITLVKPQFEVGKEGIGRGGIVRDSKLYPRVKEKITQCCNTLGLTPKHYLPSPIKGGDGNQEFLLIARKETPLP